MKNLVPGTPNPSPLMPNEEHENVVAELALLLLELPEEVARRAIAAALKAARKASQ